MPKPMSNYKVSALKPKQHDFTARGLYLEYGHVKTYANKTQADHKVSELKLLGFDVYRSYDWPFIIMQSKKA